ncbi:MAG: DNA-directed RNA polymerase [Candidatus Bathyarchaeia archaeon]|nr:DNA-directed RNA polymerase [Candidatus Bathyarchaeota archaeon]
MFRLLTVEDVVRIPPNQFGMPLSEVAKNQIKMKYENMADDEMGYVILIIDVEVDPMGKILPGDGSTYHKVTFKALTFYPEVQEVVEGEVVEVTDFGAFVRIGPEDALLHVSQVLDDYLSFDPKSGTLMGKETGRKLGKGDLVRARIIAVSFPKGGSGGKIGVTMRQPFLGKLEWIQEDVKKLQGG